MSLVRLCYAARGQPQRGSTSLAATGCQPASKPGSGPTRSLPVRSWTHTLAG
jgi:hypothetical protein